MNIRSFDVALQVFIPFKLFFSILCLLFIVNNYVHLFSSFLILSSVISVLLLSYSSKIFLFVAVFFSSVISLWFFKENFDFFPEIFPAKIFLICSKRIFNCLQSIL